ncbi:MAG TPA: hypothetical protein VFF79_10860 [Conexibacter sp.]|jgi:protein-S-isoprenylcysteine O-methyltransferase Ste14|nr:hypothetical protein [Conexibacter sp.]
MTARTLDRAAAFSLVTWMASTWRGGSLLVREVRAAIDDRRFGVAVPLVVAPAANLCVIGALFLVKAHVEDDVLMRRSGEYRMYAARTPRRLLPRVV